MNDEIYDYIMGLRLEDPASKALLMLLASLADENNRCCLTICDLSEISELSQDIVQQKILSLTKRGFITTTAGHNTKKDLYTINMR